MTNDTKYNGWTNYATWRVNLEMFDGYDPDGSPVSADMLKDIAEELIGMECLQESGLAYSYAMAFLDEVNWYEIAEHKNDEYELNGEDE
jgi:hypothetical protein